MLTGHSGSGRLPKKSATLNVSLVQGYLRESLTLECYAKRGLKRQQAPREDHSCVSEPAIVLRVVHVPMHSSKRHTTQASNKY
jgi:hypothetical protein